MVILKKTWDIQWLLQVHLMQQYICTNPNICAAHPQGIRGDYCKRADQNLSTEAFCLSACDRKKELFICESRSASQILINLCITPEWWVNIVSLT